MLHSKDATFVTIVITTFIGYLAWLSRNVWNFHKNYPSKEDFTEHKINNEKDFDELKKTVHARADKLETKIDTLIAKGS